MAPVTRAHRIRATITGENIEPLSPTLPSNIITSTRLSHSHVRFSQDEGSTPITVQRVDTKIHKVTGEATGRGGGYLNGTDGTRDEVPDGEEEDSDNDAPEAISMGAGKEEAEKREEEAKRVIEAQKEASKNKRKERDTKLKEQKSEAEERKRERVGKRRKLETKQDEQDAIEGQLSRELMAAGEEIELAPTEISSKKSKLSLLLPESLLAQVSARPSPPPSQKDSDSGEDLENADASVAASKLAGISTRLEKNKRRREQKKRSKNLKKGVVNVKVLNDEAASRKSMAPPVSKKVAHIKESWLHKQRNGGIKRKCVGGGFIRKK